jgi:hypothetical protein
MDYSFFEQSHESIWIWLSYSIICTFFCLHSKLFLQGKGCQVNLASFDQVDVSVQTVDPDKIQEILKLSWVEQIKHDLTV